MAKIKVEQIEDLHIPFKNAESFGFSPSNNGEDNATALQSAVDGGGTIVVSDEGTYDINASIIIPSNTTIIFGANVFIQKASFNGSSPRYTFINEGAFTKTYDSNIKILGLYLIANGIAIGSDATTAISGVKGQVSFHYVKNLEVRDYTCLDYGAGAYGIHVCTFEDLKMFNINVDGITDGVHIGKGSKFVLKHLIIKAGDDAIALNGHAFITGQPQIGWIENGIIEDVYDLSDATAVGFTTRMLAGAWVDWFSGMDIHRGDAIIASNNKMYRSMNAAGATIYTSNTEPTHATGTVTHDSIIWEMVQDDDITYTAGVRNVVFRNINLQKDRTTAFSFQFSDSDFSRSYYPSAAIPVQGGITFDNVLTTATLTNIVTSKTPVSDFKITNSVLEKTNIFFEDVSIVGLTYPKTNILLEGNTYNETGTTQMIASDYDVDIKILGSLVADATYKPTYNVNVNVVNSDLLNSIHRVIKASTAFTWTPNAKTSAMFENNSSNENVVSIISKAIGKSHLWFGDEDTESRGRIIYDHSTDIFEFWTASGERITIGSSGNLNVIGGGTFGGVLLVEESGGAAIRVKDPAVSTYFTDIKQTGGTFSISRDGTGGTDLSLSAGGNWNVAQQGNLGVDVASTTEKLDVNGNVKATGFKAGAGIDSNVLLDGGGVKAISDFVLQTGTTEFKATRKLSLGDILALNTTPLEVVAAQGVGTVVIVKSVNYEYTFLSAYATQTIIETKYSGQTPILSSIDILGGGADKIIGESGAGSERFENTAIEISVPTADPTAGTSTIDVYITYEVLTL